MSFYFVIETKSLKIQVPCIFTQCLITLFVWGNFGVGKFGIYSKRIECVHLLRKFYMCKFQIR